MWTEGIGIDIVEFERIKCHLREQFVTRILSVQEKQMYDKISDSQRKIEFIAGRFAAKEAYSKAYRSFEEPLNFKDVNVLKDEHGAPYIDSKYRPDDKVLLSISHSEHYVVAVCMIQRGG